MTDLLQNCFVCCSSILYEYFIPLSVFIHILLAAVWSTSGLRGVLESNPAVTRWAGSQSITAHTHLYQSDKFQSFNEILIVLNSTYNLIVYNKYLQKVYLCLGVSFKVREKSYEQIYVMFKRTKRTAETSEEHERFCGLFSPHFLIFYLKESRGIRMTVICIYI